MSRVIGPWPHSVPLPLASGVVAPDPARLDQVAAQHPARGTDSTAGPV
jgi:hypothetical protein